MHTFLTGERLIGKSTALRKFLEITGVSADGFVTRFDAARGARGGNLYIRRFDTQTAESGSRLVAVTFGGERESIVYPEVFDAFGADVLPRIGRRGIIIMDELGVLEEDSPCFVSEILSRLDGSKPIFGVIKQQDSPFLNAVRARPNVAVITVTRDNRDAAADILAEKLRDLIRD